MHVLFPDFHFPFPVSHASRHVSTRGDTSTHHPHNKALHKLIVTHLQSERNMSDQLDTTSNSKGIQDLSAILASLSPELCPDKWIFAKVSADESTAAATMAAVYSLGVSPIATFMESEGLTVIVKEEAARKLSDMSGFEFSNSPFSRITLLVHSSLDAVGLTALVATKLTEHNISANVVAGYFHDHFFVQASRAEDAMNILKSIASEHS